MGRPSKYKPEYCDQIIEYFSVTPYENKVVETIHTKGGDIIKKYKEVPSDLPLISKFARSIGVTHETIDEWARVHREFSLALKEAKKLQEAHLITNALRDNFAQAFSIFAMKNMCGWRDRQEITGADGQPITMKVINYGSDKIVLNGKNGIHDTVQV